ncbi:MAG TPA: RluA family pseudouridine synthase [Planctomycetota bacterium]|nr:RluA family pseudouridine synthase [Planctomycetota bacterium]
MAEPEKTEDPDEAERIRGETVIERELAGGRRVVRFTIGRNRGKGWRLDKYLHAMQPTISRSLLRRWLDDGHCTVDGRVAAAREKVRPGSRVELSAPLPEQDPDAVPPPPLRILLRDPLFLVVDKPVGVLAHQAGRTMTGTLVNQLYDWCALEGIEPKLVRLVNRIDRDTSGIVLVSLDDDAHVRLSAAMEARALTKEYLAICHGVPEPREGSWLDPIAEGPDESIAMTIAPHGKASHTDYRVVEAAPRDDFALLRLGLRTGRQHQIRIHAAHHGHALVGDWVYGSGCAELPGQALHAALMIFPHPRTRAPVRVEAPLDPKVAALWAVIAAGGAPTASERSAEQRSKLGIVLDQGPRRPKWLSEADYRALELEAERGIGE